jgi:hypothetical protein
MFKNILNLKNSHLLISVVVVFPIALTYGLFPSEMLPKLFDFEVQTTDLKNVFRAIMGLYLAFTLLWILGILNPQYWKSATISNLLFMAGLALGRIISMIIEGLPSEVFVFGTVGELVLAFFSAFNLVKYNKAKSSI